MRIIIILKEVDHDDHHDEGARGETDKVFRETGRQETQSRGESWKEY
jgi:hypothetical protein